MIKATEHIKQFLVKYEAKIVLVVAFCLVGAISYGFGVLQGQKWKQKPLIIEKPIDVSADAQIPQNEPPDGLKEDSIGSSGAPGATQAAVGENMTNCAYVGSKNSDKFYVPTCSWAKRIKPENLVCYKSEQEALDKGKTKSDCK